MQHDFEKKRKMSLKFSSLRQFFFPIEMMAISCFLRSMKTYVLMSRFGPNE